MLKFLRSHAHAAIGIFLFCWLSACSSQSGSGERAVEAPSYAEASEWAPEAAEGAVEKARQSPPHDEGLGRLMLPPGMEPSTASYLGLEAWTCEALAERIPQALHRLDSGQAAGMTPYCYVVGGGGDALFELLDGNAGPFEVGVAYVPEGIDIHEATYDEVRAAGGVTISVLFGVSETPRPSGDDSGREYRKREILGEPGIVRRIRDKLLMGIWFTDVPGLDRAQVIVSAQMPEQEMDALIDGIERGEP